MRCGGHHAEIRVTGAHVGDERFHLRVVGKADGRHIEERAHAGGDHVRVIEIDGVARHNEGVGAERVAGADQRAEVPAVGRPVEENNERVFGKRHGGKGVVPHFDDGHEFGGVVFAAQLLHQVRGQGEVAVRLHMGEHILRPVGKPGTVRVEQRRELPFVLDCLVDVAHALHKKLPVFIALVPVCLQNLKFLILRVF